MEFTTDAPDAFVTARNRDRSVFQPWGILGGQPGAAGSFTLNPGRPDERNLQNTDALALPPGNVLRVISPGGAGRGHPFDRRPEAVLRDLRTGRVTTEGAARDYGVAIADDVIDVEATASLRATRGPAGMFALGAAREAHEARWTEAAYAAMLERLATLPVSWRAPMKKRLFAAVRAGAVERPATEVIEEAFAAYMALHPVPQGHDSK